MIFKTAKWRMYFKKLTLYEENFVNSHICKYSSLTNKKIKYIEKQNSTLIVTIKKKIKSIRTCVISSMLRLHKVNILRNSSPIE